MKNQLLASALAAALGCSHAQSAVQPEAKPASPAFRAEKPAPLSRDAQFQGPLPTVRQLKNGARVLVVENHALPLVAVQLAMLTGVDGDPPGMPGLAGFTAELLTEGTASRNAGQIALQLEELAANLNAFTDLESSRIHLNCLTSALPAALDLLADVATRPAFRDADVERVRGLRRTRLEQKKGNPVRLAQDEVARLMFGERHPWGQPSGGTLESVQRVTPADVKAFHSKWYRPGNAVFAVAGDLTADQAVELLEQRFSDWPAQPAERPELPAFPAPGERKITLVPKDGSQSQVWTAGLLPFGAKDPDAIAARVANYSLGGLFSSRLNMNVRETKGYSYGIFSAVRMQRKAGVWAASGGIVAGKTAEALVEYENELARLAASGVTAAELAQAKEAYVRSLPSFLETNDAVAGALVQLAVQELPMDFYRTLPQRVAQVSQDEVARVVARYIAPLQWQAVVVGPAQSEEPLKKLELGPVEVRGK